MKCIACSSTNLSLFIALKNGPATTQVLTQEAVEKDRVLSMRVYQCRQCMLVQLARNAVVDSIYYKEYAINRLFSSFSNKYQRLIAKNFVNQFKLKGKLILEVGCGDGYFAKLLLRSGAKILGIDPSERACRMAKKRGINVKCAYIDRKLQLKQKFSAFTLCQVLEHMRNPVEFLSIIKQFIVPKGYGLIEVPSITKTLVEKRFSDFFPDHVAYYSHVSLAYVLEAAGYTVIDIHHAMNDEYLSATVQINDNIADGSKSYKNLKIYLTKVQRFFKKYKKKKIIMWGAGIRGISLIAYSNIKKGAIRYCIDSDPDKRGRFLPGSHLEVVGPGILNSEPFDLIVITANLYVEEIKTEIREKYKYNKEIAVLFPEPMLVK